MNNSFIYSMQFATDRRHSFIHFIVDLQLKPKNVSLGEREKKNGTMFDRHISNRLNVQM